MRNSRPSQGIPRPEADGEDQLMASIRQRPDGSYRARYRGLSGKEHAKHFRLRRDAQKWLDQETAKIETGSWVAPKTAKTTVAQWCDTWLKAYASRKRSTVRMAEVHIAKIKAEFGSRRLDSIRPLEIKSWMVKPKAEGYAPSYMFALHSRMAQLYSDAIQDGLVARSPLSRRTSPGMGRQRPYVATTEQVWALHDAIEPRYRAGLLLAGFAGLRLAEVCGLRLSDIDFMRGIVNPVRHYPAEPLKTECSRTPIPIPASMTLVLSAHVTRFSIEWLMTDESGVQMGPWQMQRAFRAARAAVDDLPQGFRFHDLRHFYGSTLIASGLDIKTVQTRMRHASAKTTLDCYGHMLADRDDATRAAIDSAITARSDSADFSRTREEVDTYRT
jgi:integrase